MCSINAPCSASTPIVRLSGCDTVMVRVAREWMSRCKMEVGGEKIESGAERLLRGTSRACPGGGGGGGHSWCHRRNQSHLSRRCNSAARGTNNPTSTVGADETGFSYVTKHVCATWGIRGRRTWQAMSRGQERPATALSRRAAPDSTLIAIGVPSGKEASEVTPSLLLMYGDVEPAIPHATRRPRFCAGRAQNTCRSVPSG